MRPYSYTYLGGHVLQGAGEGLCAWTDAGQPLARTKVGYLHHAAVRVHQHVVTLRTPLQGLRCVSTYQYLTRREASANGYEYTVQYCMNVIMNVCSAVEP